jgi:hypothetical protein
MQQLLANTIRVVAQCLCILIIARIDIMGVCFLGECLVVAQFPQQHQNCRSDVIINALQQFKSTVTTCAVVPITS